MCCVSETLQILTVLIGPNVQCNEWVCNLGYYFVFMYNKQEIVTEQEIYLVEIRSIVTTWS